MATRYGHSLKLVAKRKLGRSSLSKTASLRYPWCLLQAYSPTRNTASLDYGFGGCLHVHYRALIGQLLIMTAVFLLDQLAEILEPKGSHFQSVFGCRHILTFSNQARVARPSCRSTSASHNNKSPQNVPDSLSLRFQGPSNRIGVQAFLLTSGVLLTKRRLYNPGQKPHFPT